MTARRIVVVAVLAAAVAVAAVSFLGVGVRLAQSPPDETVAPLAAPTPALRVFGRTQTRQEAADAGILALDPASSSTVRRIGRPEGLVVLGWRTRTGQVCEGAYRPGPAPVTSISCAMEPDFATGGVSIGWPDSPDLGPFDITWTPDGRVAIASAEHPPAVPAPTPSGG